MVFRGLFKKLCAYCALCMLCALILFGCAPAVDTAAAPTPAPTPEDTAAPETEPEPENPVLTIYDSFMHRAAPMRADIEAAARRDGGIAYVPHALKLERHIQRVQAFFLALTRLYQTDESLWDGMLGGAMEGSGTVSGDIDACRFECTFWDNTIIEGSIEGGIEGSSDGSVMRAQWKYAEVIESEPVLFEDYDGQLLERAPETERIWHMFRSAELSVSDTEAYAKLYYDEAYSLLVVTKTALYFRDDADEPITVDASPDTWADWGFSDGQFYEFSRPDAQPGAQPDAQPDDVAQGQMHLGV